ncbi:MAG: hypothetical protein WDM81_00430 [Rhizomicrobium sp.]
MDQAAQEGTGGQHHRTTTYCFRVCGDDARHPPILDQKIFGGGGQDGQVRRFGQAFCIARR